MIRAYHLALPALLLAAACHRDDPETVQERAANASIRLEQRYKQLQVEAENDAATAAVPAENEADALLNQINAAAPTPANATGNAH